MGSPTFYRFRSNWELDAPRGHVFEVLKRGENYERWWPQVKRSARLSDGSYELVARSFLPYELRMVLTESVIDEGTGVLEANLKGDLEGFSRWTLSERGNKTIALFEEEVVTHKRLLNALSPVVKPLLRYNHTVMMRHGETRSETLSLVVRGWLNRLGDLLPSTVEMMLGSTSCSIRSGQTASVLRTWGP